MDQIQPTDLERRRAEFDRLVPQHCPYLRGYMLNMTRNNEDTEEIFQEAMLKAFANWHRFQPGSNLGGWLCKIAQNTWINIRRRKRRPASFSDLSWGYRGLFASEDSYFQEFLDPQVKNALGAISDDLGRALVMFAVGGYSYEDIARITGVSMGTVKSRIFRAKGMLKILLEGYYRGE